MGRSASERARHLQFTNLQLMKNLKNFWMDEAKKHGERVATLTLFTYHVFIVISLAWL